MKEGSWETGSLFLITNYKLRITVRGGIWWWAGVPLGLILFVFAFLILFLTAEDTELAENFELGNKCLEM